MDTALRAAVDHDVVVGAHVAYEDRANFGRVPRDVPTVELRDSISAQIETLQDRASRFGLHVRYVKPHGALYHRVGTDEEQATALVDAVRACDPTLELLVPFSTMLHDIAAPLPCRHEFFADRGYHLNGKLVDRSETAAHIVSVDAVAARTERWVREGLVESVEGKVMRIEAESICLHGDNAYAISVAQRLHSELTTAGVRIANWMLP